MMRCLLALLALSSLGACAFGSHGYFEDDGPGPNAPDVSRIPDAVPRYETPNAATNRPYTVRGVTYYPLASARGYHERGIASWYGWKFHGKHTATGETYDMYAMTAAHRTLPLPCYVRVRNLQNGKSVIVRVNDRGPFVRNRLIDLSYAAAARLGIIGTGTGLVDVEAVGPGYRPPTSTVAGDGEGAKPAAGVEIIPAAQAAPISGTPIPSHKPTLYVQVGAFNNWDNAVALRTRLERAALRPIFIQSVLAPGGGNQRLYRVRVGPVANVEEGDRLTERAIKLGVPDALIVVE